MFSTARLCAVMGVSTRGFRAFRNRPASRRQRADMVFLANIREQSRLSLSSYGRPRMIKELRDQVLFHHRWRSSADVSDPALSGKLEIGSCDGALSRS